MTAARCVHETRSIALAFSTINTDEIFYTVNVSKEEIIIHPKYDKNTNDNDIAVILLKEELSFGPKIDKIDMVDKDYVAEFGDSLSIFGFMESNNPFRLHSSTHLQYIDSKITYSNCGNPFFDYLFGMSNGRTFCIVLRSNGTSFPGAPIITKKKLFGIVSHSNGFPNVCTLVSQYRQFIDNAGMI